MEKRMQTGFAETRERVDRVRKIYSQIGEPLSADIIIDLYQHLGKVMDAETAMRPRSRREKKIKN